MKSAASHIAEHNQHRHSRSNYHDDRCDHCKAFVSKPEPEHGKITYVCPSCGRAILEFVGNATTD